MKTQAVAHLRAGNVLVFQLQDTTWVEAHELLDDLERGIGPTLERREVIDAKGSAIICWIGGLVDPPMVEQYKGVGNGPHDTAA